MTGPALDLINFIFKTKDGVEIMEPTNLHKYRILISFGNNEKGKSLLRLANSLINR